MAARAAVPETAPPPGLPGRPPLRAMTSALHLLRRMAGALALTACVALGALMLLPALGGMERYVITTGSMTGTYDAGSIVLADEVPVADLRVGDVITYAPPAGAAPTELVTHRIADIARAGDGRLVFRTKGDANAAADPWTFSLTQPTQARVRFGIPHAGRAILALSDPATRRIVIGLPALLIALAVLAGLGRDARREAERRRRTPLVAS